MGPTAERHTCQTLREMGFDPAPRPDVASTKVREIGLNTCPFIVEEGVRPGQCGTRLTKREV